MEEFERYRDLIDTMRKSPVVGPPEDFTVRIMARLPEPGRLGLGGLGALPMRRRAPATRAECSICFFLSGLFFFVMGVLVMGGLDNVVNPAGIEAWVTLQSLVLVVCALWFAVLGIGVMKGGATGLRAVRWGALLLIVSVPALGAVCYGASGVLVLKVVSLGFAGVGVAVGGLLALSVNEFLTRGSRV